MSRLRVAPRHAGAALAAAWLALGCATQAQTDFDPNAQFDRYRTFAWQATEGEMGEALAGQADPLLLRRIREAIEEGLVAKGYQKVEDRNSADFVVSFSVGSREKLQPQSQVSIGFGSFGRYGGGGVGVSTPVAGQSTTEGTLAIDIFDGESQEAVWHGSASKEVTPSMDRAVLVNEVVGAILAKFPPER
jgi:hypothetical protein